MALFEMTSTSFRTLDKSSFTHLKVRERDDLQRLLRSQIDLLGDDLYVIAEEFGDWDDSRRRIDLLAIDKDANLVVIELKRTNDGGHMELQAIRYASMISTMTFEKAVQIHAEFLGKLGDQPDQSQNRLLTFLGWEEPNEENFAPDVRIILVSEDFGKELTTAVLWLRDRDMDIRCVRLTPYKDQDRCLIDVQQIIPLPEANEYQIQLREKEQVERRKRAGRNEVFQKFWEGLITLARKEKTRHKNLKPSTHSYIAAGSGYRGLGFWYSMGQDSAVSELYIDRGAASENKQIFDALCTHKAEIEKQFGGPLKWERLDEKQACRIKSLVDLGGYKSPESQWPAIQTEMLKRMTRLEAALVPYLGQVVPE